MKNVYCVYCVSTKQHGDVLRSKNANVRMRKSPTIPTDT